MTSPDVLAKNPPADLVQQLSAVAEQFGSLLAELRMHTGECGSTPEQAALRRLLSGEAGSDEAMAAGLSFAGARLVVASMTDVPAALRVMAQLQADRAAVAIWQPPQHLVVLVRGVPRSAGDDRSRRAASRIAAITQRDAPGTAVGVSSTLARPEQVRAAYAEASEASAFASRQAGGLAFADECWAQVALHRLAREACRALPIDNPLLRLRDYDLAHHANMVHTLRIWLATNGDTAATASALSLHPNSLRYRIKRIQEIGDVDLDDADVRALAHVVFGRPEER